MRVGYIILSLGLASGQAALASESLLPQQPADQGPKQDLGSLGIEDLMNIEVTTASKKAQSLTEVAAAIFVVTAADIQESGATSVPDALRMVPGVQVAQMNASMWAISIRGFNSRYANKLLVLIDGRSVYTPLFSGVYWDALEVNMDDIDRIEVIRGPGGALWGANAVNGIINIITKNAAETQGGQISQSTSTTSPSDTQVRYGGKLGENGFFRVYARHFKVDNLQLDMGGKADDGWQSLRAGFRADWKTDKDTFMVTAGGNSSHLGQTSGFPVFVEPFVSLTDSRFPVSNYNVVGKWDHRAGADSSQTLQLYYDHSERQMPEVHEKRRTFDADFQSEHRLSARNRLVWGLGYRHTEDETSWRDGVSFNPAGRSTSLYSIFLSDEHALSDRLRLTLDAKIEHNDYTGWELQPSARLLWTPSKSQTVWASASRAVRTPSRADSDSVIGVSTMPTDAGIPGIITLLGNSNFESEEVTAYELGWRTQASENLFIDVAAFYNSYRNLRTFEPETPFPVMSPTPHLVLPYRYSNRMTAETAGLEVAAFWNPRSNWNLNASYSLFSDHYSLDGSGDPFGLTGSERLGSTPRHQFSIKSSMNFKYGLQFDTLMYYVDKLSGQSIPAYARVDLRLMWKPHASCDISLGVQNLFNQRHREMSSTLFERTSEVERNFYLKATWRF
ncbi:MAG: TonB-dependent receptor [Fimbriimonadaceae bacterium]|nr:TonB-dependent receptor [Fimbriimonadaceae bacterium]